MRKIKIKLKDGTEFDYEDEYFLSISVNSLLENNEQFIQLGNHIIRIESIEYITWEDVEDKTKLLIEIPENNAKLFKSIFGIYAEEFWSYSEDKMLEFINSPFKFLGEQE